MFSVQMFLLCASDQALVIEVIDDDQCFIHFFCCAVKMRRETNAVTTKSADDILALKVLIESGIID